jgi:hypothetical protein
MVRLPSHLTPAEALAVREFLRFIDAVRQLIA